LTQPAEASLKSYSLAVHDAVHRLLARSGSRLILVSLHDLLCDTNQPNVPGTVDQYPNWALRYTAQIPEILTNIVVQFILRQVRTERNGHSVGGLPPRQDSPQ
ncbi:MAG: 4-alpha-glucanotransferase, partial [Spirochaetia bacterium]|nr:4-alpha-glucanotransferase [Spirochaetia bacterium]